MNAQGKVPTLDLDEVRRGLKAIRAKHTLIAIPWQGRHAQGAVRGPGRHAKSWSWAKQWITIAQDRGENIYFHANPLPDEFHKKGKKTDITAVTHIPGDFDPRVRDAERPTGLNPERVRAGARHAHG